MGERRAERVLGQPGLLHLEYNHTIPTAKLAAMERWGKALGLPLATLEMLGQDEVVCDAFVQAASGGDGRRFVELLDLERLQEAARHPDRPGIEVHPSP